MKAFKRLTLSLTFLACSSIYAQTMNKEALELIRSSEERYGASIGLELKRLSDGKLLYSHRSRQSFTPASVVKLLSTGAALHSLGAKYRFPTIAYTVGKRQGEVLQGSLLIQGSGDPSLGSSLIPLDTERWSDELAQALDSVGLRKLSGGIYLDGSLPNGLGVHPSWEIEDIGEPYGAGLYGINFRDNVAHLELSSSAGRKARIYVSTSDPLMRLKINNGLRIGKGSRIKISLSPTQPSLNLSGIFSAGRSGYTLLTANPDPTSYALGFLEAKLQEKGIQLFKKGKHSYQGFETEGDTLYTYYSKPLDTLCIITNHRSQNLYAEAIGNRIAPELGGGKAVQNFWYKRLDLKNNDLQLSDASGLSRENKLSPWAMTQALTFLFGGQEPKDGVLVSTLPQVGRDGTVNSLMPEYEIRAFLKSGTMRGVSCYAGYIYYGGEWYTLTYLSNGFPRATIARSTLREFLNLVFPFDTLRDAEP